MHPRRQPRPIRHPLSILLLIVVNRGSFISVHQPRTGRHTMNMAELDCASVGRPPVGRKVCVIGAGASGLTTIKQLKDELAARGGRRSGLKAMLQHRLHGLLVQAAITAHAQDEAEASVPKDKRPADPQSTIIGWGEEEVQIISCMRCY